MFFEDGVMSVSEVDPELLGNKTHLEVSCLTAEAVVKEDGRLFRGVVVDIWGRRHPYGISPSEGKFFSFTTTIPEYLFFQDELLSGIQGFCGACGAFSIVLVMPSEHTLEKQWVTISLQQTGAKTQVVTATLQNDRLGPWESISLVSTRGALDKRFLIDHDVQ